MKLQLNKISSLIISAMAFHNSSYAQQADEDIFQPYEVISVTAQKRAQSIQDVPISMSAFSEDILNSIGAEDFTDLTSLVPSLSVVGGTDAFPITYIRGIGTNDTSIGADPSIGVYIDGVYASRLGGALTEFLDVERVEVLKGPQGTLFGRNAIGGAISIITKKPSEFLEGSFKLSYANYSTKKARAVINIPLLDDSLFAKIFGSLSKSDGWQTNTLSSERGYQQDRVNGGVKLTWIASDSLEINFSNTWSSYNDTAGYVDNIESALPISFLTSVVTDNQVVNGGINPFGNPANNRLPGVPIYDRVLREHWLDVTWEINDELSLTSLTTYRKYTTESAREYDGTEFFLGENVQSIESSESTGQEFRLSSNDDGIFWVLGTSIHQEKAALDFVLGLADLGAFSGTPFNNGAPFFENSLTASNTDSFAIFGDTTIALSEKLNLTAGARYSRDTKTMNYNNGLHENGAALLGGLGLIVPTAIQFIDANGQIDPSAVSLEDEWNDFSPRLVLDYKIDKSLIYASVTKGYKSGAYNSYPAPNAALGFRVAPESRNSVDPETVVNYELGVKSSLLNNDLTLNGSFYYMDYQDLQIFQVVGGITRLENAGKAVSSGLELDGRYAASNNLSILFNATWMDSEFKDYVVSGQDLSGTSLLFTPNFSGGLSLDYSQSLGDLGELRTFLTYSYKGDHLLATGIEQEAYSLMNAKLTLISEDDSWEIALYGNNLTDKTVLTNITGLLSQFGFTGAYRNAPRTYGASFTYRF
jgi:iron complex outermembrane receptor protein